MRKSGVRLALSWNSIKGHLSQITAIRKAIARDRLHHALLLAGPSGLGKRMIAYRAAASLLCGNADADDFCGECACCRRILAGTHPDVTLVEREPGKRFIVIGDDNEGKNKSTAIHSIRALSDLAFRKPFEADRKVIIVDECERITAEAQDAFLKTLEEPPANTHFFLICSNPQALHETVVSRCLMLRFYPLDSVTVREVVSNVTDMTFDRHIQLSVAFSNGSPGNAVGFSRESLIEEIEWFLDWFEAFPSADPFEASEELLGRTEDGVSKKKGEDSRSSLEPLRERLIFFFGLAQQCLRPSAFEPLGNLLPAWVSSQPDEVRADCIEAILESVRDIQANVKPQFVVDYLTVRINRYVTKQPR